MTAVVTGSNRGIGLAIVKELLKRGWSVIAATRKPQAESLKELKERYGEQLRIERIDVSDPRSIEEFSRSLKGQVVDVLFNNAGVLVKGDIFDTSYEDFLYTLKVNTLGPWYVARSLVDNLKKSKNPRILNTSSIMGSITTYSGTHSVSYTVSKAALNMVTKVMASQLRSYGIVVVSIHPGWVRTDMGGSAAPVLPEESAKGIADLSEKLTMSHTGRFFDYTGKEIAW